MADHGGDAEFMADDGRYGLISATDRDVFVVAFPIGFFGPARPGPRPVGQFERDGRRGKARDDASDDVGFSRKAASAVAAETSIDRVVFWRSACRMAS